MTAMTPLHDRHLGDALPDEAAPGARAGGGMMPADPDLDGPDLDGPDLDGVPATATAARRQALRRAWSGVRRAAAQAVRRRLHTEMTDLAGRIRRLQDGEPR